MLHQLASLARVGVRDVVIVVGYEQQQVRDVVGRGARYVVNDRFVQTNSMYSFLLAHRAVDQDVIVMNSDLFFHPDLPARLCERQGNALLYDSRSGEDPEHMKVRVADGHLVEMSKVMPRARVSGENVGMLRLTAKTVARMAGAARAVMAVGGDRAWLASAVNRVAAAERIQCVDVAGSPWVEIDFPHDLDRARTEVLPAVAEAIGLEETVRQGVPSLSGARR
ncbi:MAG: hypothetical protein QOH37_2339 [Nocardioidaceae bacterium]|nr:hypothetical protein [Nocardioidaceae bacterium]